LNLIPLADIKHHQNECVDVLAVVDKVEEVGEVTARTTQQQLKKRNVVLLDQSQTAVTMTLWNEQALSFTDENVGRIFAIKGASVREFNGGFSLSVGNGTAIHPEFEGEKVIALHTWFTTQRPSAEIGSLSGTGSSEFFERQFKAIQIVNETDMAALDKGMYVIVKAFINTIKAETIYYNSCSTEGCKKKVTPEGNQYSCERCGTQDTCRPVYLLQMEIADFSGTTWITLFEDAATKLLGKPASEMKLLYEMDRDAYDSFFHQLRFKTYEVRARVRIEVYNDQQRVRWNCQDIRAASWDRENKMYRAVLEKFV